MKRIYLTAVPLESNFVLEHKRVCPVGFELPGAPEVYAMDLRTYVGEVEVNDADQGDKFTSTGGAKTLTAHSDVGDVEVRFRG